MRCLAYPLCLLVQVALVAAIAAWTDRFVIVRAGKGALIVPGNLVYPARPSHVPMYSFVLVQGGCKHDCLSASQLDRYGVFHYKTLVKALRQLKSKYPRTNRQKAVFARP